MRCGRKRTICAWDSAGWEICSFQFGSGLDGEIPTQMVYGECTSSLAGAGFHAAAVRFVEELTRETEMEIILSDETGYGDDHDFDRMREEHFLWLAEESGFCMPGAEEQWPEAVSFGLCWDLDQYTPEEVPGTVFTPFGRFSIQKIVGWVEQEELSPFAKEFFIWNEPGRDAGYYRNTALSLMWEECYFMPGSRSGRDRRINDRIIDDLERSLLLDRSLPFPAEEYITLCRLNERSRSLWRTCRCMKRIIPSVTDGERAGEDRQYDLCHSGIPISMNTMRTAILIRGTTIWKRAGMRFGLRR